MTATATTRAWYFLVAALAVHVLDEALTGFLDFYNPLVRSIRERMPWFPMPTFTFGVWLGGLILLVIVLALLGPSIGRRAAAARVIAWFVTAVMLLNGIGHLAGSVYFERWLPGATSSPLLLLASVLMAKRMAGGEEEAQKRTDAGRP